MTPLDYALRYAEQGFAVFPLHGIHDHACTCGDRECRSPGKHPLTGNGVKDASTAPDTINAWWARWPNANIGMAMGGARRLVAIDTDPRNGGETTLEALAAEHGRFPDTAMAITGGGGTHHIFVAPEGVRLPGKLGAGVDVKGEGGYIVVEPSVHASGHSYAWEASSDPLDGQTIAPLPGWIATRQAPAAAPAIAASGFLDPQRIIELRSAMAFLDSDDRDIWIEVGQALHSTQAPQAFGLWTEWSQLSQKYDPTGQRKAWNSFTSGKGRNVESIFAIAQRAGWVNPASRAAADYSDAARAAIDEANRRVSVEVVADTQPQTHAALPVPVLEQAARWMDQRYSMTHPAATRQAMLAVAALGSSRQYIGDGDTPAHLCLGIISDASSITSYTRDAIARILDAAGLRRMLRSTRANTAGAIYNTLMRCPAVIQVVPDFGHLAQFAKRQPSGQLDQAFSVMAEAYSNGALYVDFAHELGGRGNGNDDQLAIYNPAYTTLLLSTTDQMGTLLQRGELTRGLLGYQLPILISSAGAVEHEASAEAPPKELIETLKAVRRLPDRNGDLSMADIFGAMPQMKPNLIRVRSEVDFREHMAAIGALSTDLSHRPLVMTAQQTMRRMAVALAPWANPSAPLITTAIADWCAGHVIKHMGEWLEQYSTLGNEDGKSDVGQRVVSAIVSRRSEGIPRSHLPMYCRPFRSIRDKAKRDQLIDLLIEDGDIVETTLEGKRQKVLIAAKFVRKTEKAA